MAEEKQIRVSDNNVEVVGTVSEYDLTVKQNKQKCRIDGEEKEVNSAIIYGTISVDVNGTTQKVQVLKNKFNGQGDEVKTFKGFCTLAGIKYEIVDNKCVYSQDTRPMKPIIKGKSTLILSDGSKQEFNHNGVGRENADRVDINGSIDRDVRLSKDRDKLNVNKRIGATFITTETSKEDKSVFAIEGYVSDITDEYTSDMKTTGRKNVEITTFGYGNRASVFTFIVPEEWQVDDQTLTVDDFMNFCGKGDTFVFVGDIESRTVGKVATSTKKAFGKQNDIVSGYTVTEFLIKGAEEGGTPYTNDEVDTARNEYQIWMDAELKKRVEDAQKRDAQKSNSNPKAQGLGRSKNTVPATEVESPFGNTTESPFGENPFADADSPF